MYDNLLNVFIPTTTFREACHDDLKYDHGVTAAEAQWQIYRPVIPDRVISRPLYKWYQMFPCLALERSRVINISWDILLRNQP